MTTSRIGRVSDSSMRPRTLPLFSSDSPTSTPKRAVSGDSPYITLQGEIPVNLPHGAVISLDRYQPLRIHSLGFQPAKSIPELAGWFLDKYLGPGTSILEPFAGGGTTLVEAITRGVSCDWTDYLPLSQLICKVKTHYFEPTQVINAAATVFRLALDTNDLPCTTEFSNKDFWFQPSVQDALEALKYGLAGSDTGVRPVLDLAFAATVRKMSDMNDGMILAAKRSDVAAPPARSKEDVLQHFASTARQFADAIAEWNPLLTSSSAVPRQLSEADARFLPQTGIYDAVLTSPPYINAIDYVWASKFELHWLGMVKSNRDRLDLYSTEIGTERISRNEQRHCGRTGIGELDELIRDVFNGTSYRASAGQNELRARVVYQYFVDMRTHLESAWGSLRSSGYYGFSVGETSRICGVEIPVARILKKIAMDIGFVPKFEFQLLLKNRRLNIPRNVEWAAQIKHDAIIVMRKP
jgi:hypothetical protein